jgi:hypothetical protein
VDQWGCYNSSLYKWLYKWFVYINISRNKYVTYNDDCNISNQHPIFEGFGHITPPIALAFFLVKPIDDVLGAEVTLGASWRKAGWSPFAPHPVNLASSICPWLRAGHLGFETWKIHLFLKVIGIEWWCFHHMGYVLFGFGGKLSNGHWRGLYGIPYFQTNPFHD